MKNIWIWVGVFFESASHSGLINRHYQIGYFASNKIVLRVAHPQLQES